MSAVILMAVVLSQKKLINKTRVCGVLINLSLSPSQFLVQHGGSSNAATNMEFTTFYFDVAADHLMGALDRLNYYTLSSFLITPWILGGWGGGGGGRGGEGGVLFIEFKICRSLSSSYQFLYSHVVNQGRRKQIRSGLAMGVATGGRDFAYVIAAFI